LRNVVSQLRQSVSVLEKWTTQQKKEIKKGKMPLEATPDEVKRSRFSPRLIQSLRKRLGVTQKEMASLAGVTVGAIYQWSRGSLNPEEEKRDPRGPEETWPPCREKTPRRKGSSNKGEKDSQRRRKRARK